MACVGDDGDGLLDLVEDLRQMQLDDAHGEKENEGGESLWMLRW